MVIEFNEVAWSNALFAIEVRALPAAKDTVWRAVAALNALCPIAVTVFGITASPAQFVLPVTTLSVIVKEPPVLQSTELISEARTIVRPFHVVASPKPVAAKPMFATGSLPTELKAPVPTVVGAFPSKVTEVSEVAFLNAELPIEVMLFGMVIEVSEVAPSKALRPIEVRALPAPKVTVLSAVAPLNVLLPIEVTLFGMVIEVRAVAALNA